MALSSPDTDQLIQRVRQGDSTAGGQLLDRFRGRLRQMVAIRLDRRLAARVDPSDVVQEVLAEATEKLPRYGPGSSEAIEMLSRWPCSFL